MRRKLYRLPAEGRKRNPHLGRNREALLLGSVTCNSAPYNDRHHFGKLQLILKIEVVHVEATHILIRDGRERERNIGKNSQAQSGRCRVPIRRDETSAESQARQILSQTQHRPQPTLWRFRHL